MGLLNGVLIARLKIPPFIATLGMLNIARGLALVITQTRPIYFSDTPEFNTGSHGQPVRDRHLGLRHSEHRDDHVRGGPRRRLHPQPDRARPVHLRARQQRRGGSPLGRQCPCLEDGRCTRSAAVRRPRRGADCRARSTRPNRRSALATNSTPSRLWSSGAPRSPEARARSSARSSAPSSCGR